MSAPALDIASPAAWWRWLRRWRQAELVDTCDRVAVLTHVDEGGRLGPRYAFMTLLSAGIAMLGLLQGSGAVIIGAMLISPLMGPIVEMGMALATFDFRTLRDSLRTMAVGVALALAISFAIVAISPLQEPTPEILSRTEPTLFDLLVAVFSGLAGAYATVTRKGETIVGVAIATALMPPLAVCGYGIAVGNMHIAGGAGFLFMTNLLAIALSVTIVARLYGFGGSDSPKQSAWQALLIVGCFVVLSIPLGIALRDIAARGLIERTVRQALEAEADRANGRVSGLRVVANANPVQVDAVLMVPAHLSNMPARLERELEARLARPVDVQVRELLLQDQARIARETSTLAQLRSSVAQLQDAAARQTRAREVRENAREATREAVLVQLGRIEALQDGRQRLLLDPGLGLSLAAARRLQPPAAAGAPVIEVVPPMQPLPRIVFTDDSTTLDADARARVDTAAWAARRWRVPALRLTGFGGTPRLAQARADAVAGLLRDQGLKVSVVLADRETLRERVRADGAAAARSVLLDVGTADP
jgi:uncharacterized hydrophobic protein (TIGR00271 family)